MVGVLDTLRLASSTTLSAMVKAPEPVTSPVCVALPIVLVAPVAIPSSFAPSTDTSRPSKVELVVTAPVNAPPPLGRAFAASVPCAAVA